MGCLSPGASKEMQRGKLYLGCLMVLGLIYGLPVRFGVVLGESMAPTFHNGQIYILDRGYYRRHTPSPNDVLVFKRNGIRYVKRVAAVAGDQIYVSRNQDVARDELVYSGEVDRLKTMARKWPKFRFLKPVARKVPDGYCYVLGDHLSCSEDSRELGFIPLDAIEGRVLFTTPANSVVTQLAVVSGPKTL